MLGGPASGQVVGGPLRGADAAADTQHEVVAGAQLGVRGEQQVVEVLPRVVATGAAALDVDDDREVRDLVRDADHRADLRDGARLERDVAEAGLGQLVDDRDGFVELGDAGGDDDAVERCARGAGPRDEALATHVQLPQVRVQEHRVELDGAARLEQPFRPSTLSAKICSVTWPPPASSAQWPAFAAAATIAGSTVVGVMPASRIGERPVSFVNAVSTATRPSAG